MIKKSTIPTILGVIVLLAGTFLGVFYLNMTQIFRIGASPQTAPKDVRIGSIADNSATVTWTTDGETTDFITWGDSQNSISKVIAEDSNNSKFFNHAITITGLTENTNYYFKINSNGVSYDNNGLPWQFTTGAALSLNNGSSPISGSVISASGNPEARALVYLNVGGYLESTLTSDTGNFVFQLAQVRNPDLQSYATIDPATTLLEISVVAGADGVASAQIFPQSAKPIPPIKLGGVYDYRNLAPSQGNQNPGVNLQLPENSPESSKFDTSSTGTPKPTSVILENITEGEVITTTDPQFLGKGPGGEVITITVHSEVPISESVKIPTSGSWSWTPPQSLNPGAHSITISWIDTSGITRSLTRNFVVQAGEAPAFTASESGTTTTPTPGPLETVSPLGTETPIPEITPEPTALPTNEPVPVTGDAVPTTLLFFAGALIFIFSFAVWKMSES